MRSVYRKPSAAIRRRLSFKEKYEEVKREGLSVLGKYCVSLLLSLLLGNALEEIEVSAACVGAEGFV